MKSNKILVIDSSYPDVSVDGDGVSFQCRTGKGRTRLIADAEQELAKLAKDGWYATQMFFHDEYHKDLWILLTKDE